MATESKVARIATEATAASTAQAKQVMTDSTVQARKMLEEGTAQARVAMEKGVAQAMKAAEDAVEFNKGNVEAVSKATQLYVVGVQDISKQAFAMMQSFADQAMENAKALSSVKSLKEAADLQAGFSKAAMEKGMSESAKLQEATFKLAEQLAAPFAARMTLAFEKVTKPVAA